jgi:hypothetical protein
MTGFVIVGVVTEVKQAWPSGQEGKGSPAVDVYFSGGAKGNPIVVRVKGQRAMRRASVIEPGAVVWLGGQAPYGGIRSRVKPAGYFTELVVVSDMQVRVMGWGDPKTTEPCSWFVASGTINKMEAVRRDGDGVEHGPTETLDVFLNVFEERDTRARRDVEHPAEMLVVRASKGGKKKASGLAGGTWVVVSAMTPWGGVAMTPTRAMYWTEARVTDEAQVEVLP